MNPPSPLEIEMPPAMREHAERLAIAQLQEAAAVDSTLRQLYACGLAVLTHQDERTGNFFVSTMPVAAGAEREIYRAANPVLSEALTALLLQIKARRAKK